MLVVLAWSSDFSYNEEVASIIDHHDAVHESLQTELQIKAQYGVTSASFNIHMSAQYNILLFYQRS